MSDAVALRALAVKLRAMAGDAGPVQRPILLEAADELEVSAAAVGLHKGMESRAEVVEYRDAWKVEQNARNLEGDVTLARRASAMKNALDWVLNG